MGARTMVGRIGNYIWNEDLMMRDGRWASEVRREKGRQEVIARNRELAPPDLTEATIRAVRDQALRQQEGRSRRSTMRSLLGGM